MGVLLGDKNGIELRGTHRVYVLCGRIEVEDKPVVVEKLR